MIPRELSRVGTPLNELVLLKNPSVVVMNHGLRGRGRHLGVIPPEGVGLPAGPAALGEAKGGWRLKRTAPKMSEAGLGVVSGLGRGGLEKLSRSGDAHVRTA